MRVPLEREDAFLRVVAHCQACDHRRQRQLARKTLKGPVNHSADSKGVTGGPECRFAVQKLQPNTKRQGTSQVVGGAAGKFCTAEGEG